MRKAAKPLDFSGYLEGSFGEGGYSRSDALDEDMKAAVKGSIACLYTGREYPDMLIAGYGDVNADAERVIAALTAVFPQKPFVARETADDRLSALCAFRADSYLKFAPAAPGPAAPGPVSPRPVIFLRKTSLKSIEEYHAGGADFASPAGVVAAAEARPSMPAAMAVEHPAEFIVARLFMPPRLNVAQYHFAAVPVAVAPSIPEPGDSLRFGFDASWTFAGQSLSVRYYVDLPSSLGARAEALAKAVAAGSFKDALAFWGSWKKPIESPSIVAIATGTSSAVPASPGPDSAFMLSEIRGEGMRFPFAVEFPQKMIGLFLRMANVAPLESDAGEQTPPLFAIELFRANDRLFIMMKASYRRSFLGNPPGPVPFEGPTLFGLLSLMDDADKSVIVQNFLVPRYELANLPLLFFYHEPRQNAEGETEYRLKAAFPMSRSDVERYLSEAQRKEWLYHLGTGCSHRRINAAAFAGSNRDATVELARAGASGKILLSRKAMDILREEVLAPIEAEDERALADDSRVAGAMDALKALNPKVLAELLMKIDDRTLAMAALSMPGLDAIVMRGLSHGRQGDLRTEFEAMRGARKRSELSAGALLDARNRLIGLANQCDDELMIPFL